MNFRKHLGLIIGCSVAGLLAIGAGVLLFFAISGSGKAQSELKSEQGKLDQLTRRKPYPNKENVELSQKKLESLGLVLSGTVARLSKGQVEAEAIEPAQFAPMLERTLNQLRKDASNAAVQIPPAFAFGFDRYSAGSIPMSNDVPRLVAQLKTMSRICGTLFAANVSNIVAVTRDEFETGVAPSAAAGGARAMMGELAGGPASAAGGRFGTDLPPIVSNELFQAERLQLTISGRENSIWEVLNAMVAGPLFTVIRDIQMESATAGVKIDPATLARPGAAGFGGMPPGMLGMERMGQAGGGGLPIGLGAMPTMPAASTNQLIPSREDRVIAGRETVRMTLVVDVFSFATAKDAAK